MCIMPDCYSTYGGLAAAAAAVVCQVANRLYRSCGFQEHSSESKYANVSSLGERVEDAL
jgi:hypothetical protein